MSSGPVCDGFGDEERPYIFTGAGGIRETLFKIRQRADHIFPFIASDFERFQICVLRLRILRGLFESEVSFFEVLLSLSTTRLREYVG